MMSTSKAFIFSLDAFVAFTLSLVAIYSLIFFSSIPSAHYPALLQAHTLAKDTIIALSLTEVEKSGEDVSLLDYVVLRGASKSEINEIVGTQIPDQFGYTLEKSDDGDSWEMLYDTKKPGTRYFDDNHNENQKRLSISTYSLVLEYEGVKREPENPYGYSGGTCSGNATPCNTPTFNRDEIPQPAVVLVRLTVFV